MTTEQSPDIQETQPDPRTVIADVDALLAQVAEIDAAAAVEPLAQITSLLNSALDSAQERL